MSLLHYLHDTWLAADDYNACINNVVQTLSLLDRLEFVVNLGKSVLIPTPYVACFRLAVFFFFCLLLRNSVIPFCFFFSLRNSVIPFFVSFHLQLFFISATCLGRGRGQCKGQQWNFLHFALRSLQCHEF